MNQTKTTTQQMTHQIGKNILKALTAIAILFFMAYLMFPFLSAMIMGAILAFALSSTLSFLSKKGFTTKASLNYLMAGLLIVALAPTLAFFIRGSGVLTKTLNNSENREKLNLISAKVTEYVEKISPTLGLTPEDIKNYITQAVQKVSEFTLDIFSKVMTEVPNLVLFSVIMFVSTYFFLVNEEKIRNLFDRYFYFSEENGQKFVQILKSSSREVFLTNVLTGLLQAFVVTIGAAIFQFNEWFLIFFITFIASFIPILGAGPIALLLSIISFASESYTSGIGMLVISIISGTTDNVIRPYLASLGTVEVPGVISFIAVIGGVITMGLPGLFVGPLVASLAFGALPILLEEFLPSEKNNSENITSDKIIDE